ncbi:MAG TPA: hypothetical protein PLT00_15405 [Verrucomicrobiota bacterium]|nr:hypothetical protein [Verrucomicrobiota bacterium]HQB18085.1 hypothetical protein [Verrucomicrobiota bacterium]
MSTLPTVHLKPGEADRVVAGHPWVYRYSVRRLTPSPVDGDLVQVKDHRQRLLGVGFFNSKSQIQVRMLAPERVMVDRAFFQQRLQAALAVRRRFMPDATSFRIVNAESDFLSGLIVDKYEDVLVVQISALGMERHKASVVAALQELLAPRAILERSDGASRAFEGLPEANGLLAGELAGFYYVQALVLDPAGRTPPEIARHWTEQMVAAIRRHDARHLITLGFLPNSGTPFIHAVAPALDFVCVHLYPQAGKLAAAREALRRFQVGKPVVVEETFPLHCRSEELAAFIQEESATVAGWLSFYWGQTPEELAAESTMSAAIIGGWLEQFGRTKPPQ